MYSPCYSLQDFGEHAREFVSSELGLSFIDLLANPAAIKALVGGGARGDRVVAQLGNITWKVSHYLNIQLRLCCLFSSQAVSVCQAKHYMEGEPIPDIQVTLCCCVHVCVPARVRACVSKTPA